jgi:hypothetical protein
MLRILYPVDVILTWWEEQRIKGTAPIDRVLWGIPSVHSPPFASIAKPRSPRRDVQLDTGVYSYRDDLALPNIHSIRE